jgi:phosphoglycolate phosphatase-like HAD superfamily hydrolase
MRPILPSSGMDRRVLLSALALLPALSAALLPIAAQSQSATSGGLLPSWNDGPAKQAIFDFVRATIDRSSPSYLFPDDRIAVFDQDGTLWVEHPMYTQVVYCLERVPAVVAKKPELKNAEPFKTVLSGNREAMAKLSMQDLEKVLAATLTGMSVEEFNAEAKAWMEKAKHPRWNRLYTELAYQPMLEALRYLRDNAYKTYIVTGGGQDFVRVYAEKVYGIPPEQVVGTAGGTKYGYAKDGKPFLTKEPKLLLNDNNAGKAEGIHLMIGRGPTRRSATRPATARCWSTPRPAAARGWRCCCCTTTGSGNMRMGRRRVCPRPRSAPSPRRCTMMRSRRAGW